MLAWNMGGGGGGMAVVGEGREREREMLRPANNVFKHLAGRFVRGYAPWYVGARSMLCAVAARTRVGPRNTETR